MTVSPSSVPRCCASTVWLWRPLGERWQWAGVERLDPVWGGKRGHISGGRGTETNPAQVLICYDGEHFLSLKHLYDTCSLLKTIVSFVKPTLQRWNWGWFLSDQGHHVNLQWKKTKCVGGHRWGIYLLWKRHTKTDTLNATVYRFKENFQGVEKKKWSKPSGFVGDMRCWTKYRELPSSAWWLLDIRHFKVSCLQDCVCQQPRGLMGYWPSAGTSPSFFHDKVSI